MLTTSDATTLITQLQGQWIEGLRKSDYTWLETHLADDFQFSAHPLPALKLSKGEFIEMDKKIRNPQIRFVSIHAEPVGELILSRTVADVKEEFNADLGPGMPSTEEIRKIVGDQRLAYASAWRRTGQVWQCFDHRFVAILSRSP